MSSAAWFGIVVGALVGTMLLYEMTLHRRPQPRPSPAGGSPCGTCGTAGTLSVLTTSSNEESSSDIVMFCSRCGSSRRL